MITVEYVYAEIKVDPRIIADLAALVTAYAKNTVAGVPEWLVLLSGHQRSHYESGKDFLSTLLDTCGELGFVLAADANGTTVITDDNGKFLADNVCFLLHEAMKHYNSPDYVCINVGYGADYELAEVNVKDDVFGGCAYFITKDGTEMCSTHEWLTSRVAAHTGERPALPDQLQSNLKLDKLAVDTARSILAVLGDSEPSRCLNVLRCLCAILQNKSQRPRLERRGL